MDLLPKTIVGVRRDVRSIVYRSALQKQNYGCYGFLLGVQEEFTRPIFDVALVVRETKSGDTLENAPARLETKLGKAREVAVKSGTEVIGLFIAWEASHAGGHRHKQFGILVDAAERLQLPFLVEFSTAGHESTWGLNVFFVGRFPHERLPYKMLPRRSRRSEDNPRRILRVWNALLA